jgi:putative pyruvate formate lyase activating enzyme
LNGELAKIRLDRIRSLAENCRLCPRRCGVNRTRGGTGACGAGRRAALFMEYVHWAEDADLVPAQTLYLAGCNLGCRFCQTRAERNRLPEIELTPALFRDILARGREAGAATVNVLGGEPTVNLPALLELFAETGDFPGLVWNTNLYGSSEAFELLAGVADIFLGDLKFGNPGCAAGLAGAADAGEVARERAEEIFARSPEALIVRHLVLPGHFACCARPVLEWIGRRLPGVRVSLKTIYAPPPGLAPADGLNRFLPREEAGAALELAREIGLRLTRDAPPPLPAAPGTASRPGSLPTVCEALISPEGGIYLRHITREVFEAARAAAAPRD